LGLTGALFVVTGSALRADDLPSRDEVFLRAFEYVRSLRSFQFEMTNQSGRTERYSYDNGRVRDDVFEPGTDRAGFPDMIWAFDGTRHQTLRSRGRNRVLIVHRGPSAINDSASPTPFGQLYLWLFTAQKSITTQNLRAEENWQLAIANARVVERQQEGQGNLVRVEIPRPDVRRRYLVDFDEENFWLMRSYECRMLADDSLSGSCRLEEFVLVGPAEQKLPFPIAVSSEQSAQTDQLALGSRVSIARDSLRVNVPLTDVEFTISPPPGTDVLDADVLKPRAAAENAAENAAAPDPPRKSWRTLVIVAVNLVVIAAVAAFFIYRSAKARK
jgi:hypothetical protein